MDSDQILLRAIHLVETGNKVDGRELLRQITQTEPANVDAWYVYAQYCGNRSRAIRALEHVLELEPDYPGARSALAQIAPDASPVEYTKPQPAFVTLEEGDPWAEILQPELSKSAARPDRESRKKGARLPPWFLMVIAVLTGCLLIGCLGLGALIWFYQP